MSVINCEKTTAEIKAKKIRLKWFNILNLDLWEIPRNISGVSVSLRSIHYKLSDLENLKCLDLADSKVRRIKLRKPITRLFDEIYCRRLVAFELVHRRKKLNADLFRVYDGAVQHSRQYIDVIAIVKYLKVFNVLQVHRTFESSRDIASLLLKTLSVHNVHSPILVRAIFDSVFKNKPTVCCLFAIPDISFSFVQVTSRMEKNELFQLLSGIFETHDICPVLGSIFNKNRLFLKMLLNLRMKKMEFSFIVMPSHRRLMLDPLYTAFKPIYSYGKVRLNPKIFKIRDHLLFEIIVVLWMQRHSAVIKPSFIRCALYVINKTSAYPYMSVAEMQTRVRKIAPSLPEGYLENIVESYKAFFPEAPKETCPRSLKELCRCTIRDSLHKEFPTYQALQMLRVPESILRYLDFRDD